MITCPVSAQPELEKGLKKTKTPVPVLRERNIENVNLEFVLGFMVAVGFVPWMPATSGTGSVSCHSAIKGGSLGWLSLQEVEQQRGQGCPRAGPVVLSKDGAAIPSAQHRRELPPMAGPLYCSVPSPASSLLPSPPPSFTARLLEFFCSEPGC